MATTPIKFHTLRREQWFPTPVEEVFAFFSEAANLGVITPPWLAFRILTPPPARISEGVKIRYRIVWHGVPMPWTTVIRRWDPPSGFVDVQLQGPYRLWHHTHRFEPSDGGTRMKDIVRYRLPLGIIGRAAHFLKVRRDIEKIFDYRFQRINELFGGKAPLEKRLTDMDGAPPLPGLGSDRRSPGPGAGLRSLGELE